MFVNSPAQKMWKWQKIFSQCFSQNIQSKMAESKYSLYASKIYVVTQSRKELQAQKMLESATNFTTGEWYEVGLLWSEPEPNLPNNYGSALGQLHSLERKFKWDPNLKGLYQQSIHGDFGNAFVKILNEAENKGTFGKEWYLPHHLVLNPNKPGKVRRVCNAASKYKEVCLNDKLIAGSDILHGLFGTIFRFREGSIALTADIESLFLQVQVAEQDRIFMETKFYWAGANIRIQAPRFWSEEFNNVRELRSQMSRHW